MYTRSEIEAETFSRSFQRGVDIAKRNGSLQGRECTYLPTMTTISAYVLSSSGWSEHYDTSVSFNDYGIVDYECSCPAFLNYDGMCKHCVALALDFLKNPESYTGWQRNPHPQTTPELLNLLTRTARDEDVDMAGMVDLIPEITLDWNGWNIGYRISTPDAEYVVKDLGDFAEALQARSTVTFGKKLTLTLTPACFTDHGREHAEFIQNLAKRRTRGWRGTGDLYGSYGTSRAFGASQRGSLGRTVNMSDEEAITAFDLLGQGSFTFKNARTARPYTFIMTIRDENPQLPLRIEEQADGGYMIVPEGSAEMARDGKRLYIYYDESLFRCMEDFALQLGEFLESTFVAGKMFYVSQDDMPLFGATLLTALQQETNLEAPASVERYRRIPGHVVFLFDRVDKHIEVTARVFYGETIYHLAVGPSALPSEVEILRDREDGTTTQALIAGITSPEELNYSDGPMRDLRLEEKALALLMRYFLPDATIPLDSSPLAGDFLYQGLSEFRSVGEVYTTPAFDRLIMDRKPRIGIGLSLEGNLINMDVSSSDLSPDELAAVLSAYRRRKHYHRLADGRILNLDDMNLAELEDMIDDLGIDPAMLKSGSVMLPTYRAFYLNEELEDATRSDSFKQYLERFDHRGEAAYPLPEGLHADLRPYQVAGFEWMSTLLDMGLGGILADEMGLGKTLQLITLVLARLEAVRASNPVLIVCPASLVYNWVEEINRFAPDISVRAIVGTKQERERIRNENAVDVFVTSYDMVRCDREQFAERSYFLCVLDEAQYIKNHATLTTRAVKSLNADHRLALTGTPIENRLSELWSLFDFLMPGILGQYMKFRERFESAIIGGDEEATRRLQMLVSPFVLRRLKHDVMPELPEKLEQTVYVPLAGEQRKLYDANEQALRRSLGARKAKHEKTNKVEVLAELTKLRQICCDPSLLYENYRGHSAKLDAIEELVEQVVESETKCLVFSQFTTYLELIAKRLDAREIPYYTITGRTPKKTRVDLARRFNSDAVPVFLISLKAGGTGLNLTGATVVIHADPWWNAAAQNQATDRAHRIGQEEVVSVCRVIAKGTIEERILKLQEAKANLADAVVGMSDGGSLGSLSSEELMELLS